MSNKRSGYTTCFVEMPDELLETLTSRCHATRESRTCVVNKAVAAFLHADVPAERLCPVRGRPRLLRPTGTTANEPAEK